MSWRIVVVHNTAKLDLQLQYLVVRSEMKTQKIHISEIALLLVESTSVSLTVGLLAELTRQKVKVIFCDHKRNPSSELISYYGSHDTNNFRPHSFLYRLWPCNLCTDFIACVM